MFRLINKLKNRKGFTLIELIVVLAVLAVIMAIAVPRFLSVQKEAEIDADQATIDMIAKAAELYYVQTDSNGTGVTIDDLDDYIDDDYELKSGDSSFTQLTSSSAIVFDDNGHVTSVGSNPVSD